MKKRFLQLLLVTFSLFIFLFSPVSIVRANADTGPKPSVRVSFINMEDSLCYGTLLSERESTGPYSVWDGDENHIFEQFEPQEKPIWRAFVEYKDKDGYFYLQNSWKVSETKAIAWTYHPPKKFKILLYYPEIDTFIVSGVYERYAFDSYYTVDMDGSSIGSIRYDENLSTDERIKAYRSYQYKREIIGLIARILITVLIEMGVALLFGFRNKKQLWFLVGVNGGTQILLNILLNVIDYYNGFLMFTLYYILFELIVFAVEAILYCLFIHKLGDKRRKAWFYILYAFVANAVSFTAGMVTANIIPDIF